MAVRSKPSERSSTHMHIDVHVYSSYALQLVPSRDHVLELQDSSNNILVPYIKRTKFAEYTIFTQGTVRALN